MAETISRSGRTKIKRVGNLYKIYSRREGEWFQIGTSTTFESAKAKGRSYTKQTLGVSVRISKNKKLIPFSLGSEYKPSKKDPFTLIQKRKFRLGTKSELKEISFFKRIKRRKKKRGFR